MPGMEIIMYFLTKTQLFIFFSLTTDSLSCRYGVDTNINTFLMKLPFENKILIIHGIYIPGMLSF